MKEPDDTIEKRAMLSRRQFGEMLLETLRTLEEFESVQQIERRKFGAKFEGEF